MRRPRLRHGTVTLVAFYKLVLTPRDFESWAEYLGDAPLAMALLDRVVDGATIVKLKGKSYRVHRGPDKPPHR